MCLECFSFILSLNANHQVNTVIIYARVISLFFIYAICNYKYHIFYLMYAVASA